MFKRNLIFFKCLQHLSAETDLGVHEILFNIDGTEALLTCNTCDHVLWLLAGAFYDPCTIVLRRICITDVDRNAFLTNREDSILMQHGSTHIRKLSQFAIGNCFNALRIIDDTRISDQKA